MVLLETPSLPAPHHHRGADARPDLPDAGRELAELSALLAPHFQRAEPREQAARYLDALLHHSGASNSWRLAAGAGDTSPWRMQRLLTRARWDHEAVRRTTVGYLMGQLAHPRAVLHLGQAHMRKKGARTVAVARQYAEATGRVENCQTVVMATYLSPRGRCALDRELYLPREWCADPERCHASGVAADRLEHRCKARLAQDLVERARDQRVPFSWVCGGVTFGLDEGLRAWLEASGTGYVLATPAGQAERGPECPDAPGEYLDEDGERWLLSRLPCGDGEFLQFRLVRDSPLTGRRECYVVHAPRGTSLAELTGVATGGPARPAPGAPGPDGGLHLHEVRTWTAWYRHTSLSLTALAARAVAHARTAAPSQP